MAELLSTVKSYIGKYTIESLIDKNIAICITNIEDLNMFKKKLIEMCPDSYDYLIDTIYKTYRIYSYEICIAIESSYMIDKIHIIHCNENWFNNNGYEIIEFKDVIL